MSTATKVLAILLAASLGLNLLAGWAYLGQRDKAVTHKVEERHATGVALKCSEGTQKLETAASQREADAKPRREAAAEKALEHEKKAQQILATPPAVPGNACASAQAVLESWWEENKP